ncbi:7547_t:CDS:2 [Funneliformis mosseae]|uniref:7547_t:CDS:1 n=1 Tax=Funneliformis mosseae TaxID=27381 RepID=A0A9N9CLQ9_FUNMO|nr:7547_t:CDS:2 [Funneliformis mosseae]
MGGSYLIAGRNVQSHYLALAVLTSFGLGIMAVRAKSKPKIQYSSPPPINSSSAEEEAFIKEFLKLADEKKKENH